MKKHLLLVDYETVHKIDLSLLDDSYQAIIFVGANQEPPKAARNVRCWRASATTSARPVRLRPGDRWICHFLRTTELQGGD